MGARELRARPRGELPTERPNPRHRAHVSSFLPNVRPRSYANASAWFTHTFRLGFLAVYFFVVEVITVLALMFYYEPSPDAAYKSILRLQAQVPWGEVLRDVHRLAAELTRTNARSANRDLA
jgi:quinol-cytochrome oxidoreductase complex cytochrome b subunit